MKSELSFLLDILLNHKLPPETKQLVADRIAEIEVQYSMVNPQQPPQSFQQIPNKSYPRFSDIKEPKVLPLEQVAVTPAAQEALQSRQEAISQSLNGKVEKGRTSPRKY